MRYRSALVGLLLVGLTLGMSTAVPAQTSPVRRVIEVTLSEFKYEPNQIEFREGETVVLKLNNAGPRFPHNISSRYWLNISLTIRGDVRQGVSEERRWVALDPGKSGEVEFVAQGRGSFAILCSILRSRVPGPYGSVLCAPRPAVATIRKNAARAARRPPSHVSPLSNSS